MARRDISGSVVHYYFSDHVGSTGVVENATASSCEQDIDYYPFGEVVHDYCGSVTQHYRFDGKERDVESGLDNFGARYHNYSLARFMTPDWAAKPVTVPYAKFGDPQSLNLYSFVENSPVDRIDPDGHDDAAPAASDSGEDQKPGNAGQATNQQPQPQQAAQNTSGKTIAKGAGEVGLGGAAIGLAIALAPETGGGSLAALGVAAGVLGGTAEVGNGIVDIAHGAGQVDAQTAEEAKQGINIANNPVAANALIVTNAENAERIGNVANGVMALHDIAKRPEGVADAFSKLMGARDVKEGYQGAKELMHQVGSYLQEKAPSLYQYF